MLSPHDTRPFPEPPPTSYGGRDPWFPLSFAQGGDGNGPIRSAHRTQEQNETKWDQMRPFGKHL